MKKLTLALITASLVFLGGCFKQKVDKSQPIMKVNSSIITENMFKENLEQSYSLSGQKKDGSNQDDPRSQFISLIHKNRVINELIIRELVLQEAEKRQIKVENSEIDEEIDAIAKSMGGKERFMASLALNKIDEESFKENIKIDLIKKRLVTSIIGDNKISGEEIQKFYDENKEDKFKHDEQVKASHILISASEADIKNKIKSENSEKELSEDELQKKAGDELKKLKQKAKNIYKELKDNPDKFAEYAKQYSEDPSSASKGGDLGFFSKEEMVPEFSKAAFETKPGNLSDIVKTEFGYHIIKVVDRKEEGITPLDEIKPHIERYLDGKRKMETFSKLITGARESAKIEYLQEEYDPENIKEQYQTLIQDLKKAQENENKKAEEAESSEKTEKN